MSFLTQSRFPTLWRIFQYWFGGTVDKRKLCILKYQDQKQILEVGCSVGNIAKVFLNHASDIRYTGIDIDPIVIKYAQKDFSKFPSFRFLCQDLRIFAQDNSETFDYILFAGVLHHINRAMAHALLRECWRLTSNDKAKLIIVDPLLPEPADHWFLHLFVKMEQGSYLRREADMVAMLRNVPNFQLKSAEIHYIGATPFSWPICARFGVYELHRTTA